MNIYSFDTIVVGSGCAGLNCLDHLLNLGVDCALVTEGLTLGTSFNTGSDKQTYYKLTLSGGGRDSVYDMAASLFSGGAMDGGLALCEAAGSAGAFYRLCGLGVPFPANEYGEYVGYRTDHDSMSRATSCGPLTSKYMSIALQKSVKSKNAVIFEGFRAIEISVEAGVLRGFFAVNPDETADDPLGLCFFACKNLVWATGGPSEIYDCTVYPESQSCAHGALFRAGAEGVNLTESQYGIASLFPRWNLSGSYQQVIPRYFSTAADGFSDERELSFNPSLVFLKGYQWPFDPRKLPGSSEVDMAIYKEKRDGRRVYMDFRRNADNYSFDALGDEAKAYLEASGAVGDAPLDRLRKLNERAYRFYLDNGVDLAEKPLEIAVCAQHNNGGFAVDINYETTIPRVFAIGEAAGVFGVYRPGGSALNSTQVSSARAAMFIAEHRNDGRSDAKIPECRLLSLLEPSSVNPSEPTAKASFKAVAECIRVRREFGRRFDGCAAFIRNRGEVEDALTRVKTALDSFKITSALPVAFRQAAINFDILTTQYVYLSAIREYISDSGKSRGSYLIDSSPEIDTAHFDKRCFSRLDSNNTVSHRWETVRPIPQSEQWFEKVYNSKKETL